MWSGNHEVSSQIPSVYDNNEGVPALNDMEPWYQLLVLYSKQLTFETEPPQHTHTHTLLTYAHKHTSTV